ncbi:MAG TPA: carbonate dehydratase [Candidatus Acidoferrales bacterium]|nr:carbonate dehydratase [Candidatus Acidoferrales bacterium]
MRTLKHLFENNKRWAERLKANDPEFFSRLANQQSPKYLWIGCSDSRVPATEVVDLLPGEIFVHRNIANLVVHTDFNCLSVIQFAVEILKVKDIIVCGHYGCGGVKAAMENSEQGLLSNWLQHIRDLYIQHGIELESRFDEKLRHNLLCELNVMEQVWNVSQTTFVQNAWKDKEELNVHGWIYGLSDGILKDLDITVTNGEEALLIRKQM